MRLFYVTHLLAGGDLMESSELENFASLSLTLGLPLILRTTAGLPVLSPEELMSDCEDEDDTEPDV